MEAWHLFVVDVTATAMRMGATASVCAAARAAVEALATEERSRVAVMTFDDRVHFYSLKGGATRMIIMPDIEVLPLWHSNELLCSAALCCDALSQA